MNTQDNGTDATERIPARPGGGVAGMPGAPLQAGDRVGPYRIVALLGSGGMGEVYHAEQLQPVHRPVAIKRLRVRRLDARQRGWFEIERQVLAQMQHPAVAQIFDAGTDAGGAPYFAMEYIDGLPLLRYCDERGLDLRQRLELLLRVCEGVQHAHQKGIVHRDLKPDNILVQTVDSRATPRIIDFGIATAADRTRDAAAPREIVGTPDYMSPEQRNPAPGGVDLRSDVYALGVILFELLVDARPDVVDTAAGEAGVARSPSRILRSLPDGGAAVADRRGISRARLIRRLEDDLDFVALKAVAPDPDARYPGVTSLADDLRCWLAGRAVSAAPGGNRYLLRKFGRRHRRAFAAGCVALIALLAGFALSLYGLMQADAQREIAELRGRELEQVIAFQQGMLEDIDVDAMGAGLTELQRRRIEQRLADDPQRQQVLAAFDAATALVAPSELARELLDRYVLTGALSGIDGRFGEQQGLAADLRESAADVYASIGAHRRAADVRDAVLEARRENSGPLSMQALRAERDLGVALSRAGDHARALALLAELDRRVRTIDGLPADFRARVAGDYARSLVEAGNPDAAVAVLQQALMEASETAAKR